MCAFVKRALPVKSLLLIHPVYVQCLFKQIILHTNNHRIRFKTKLKLTISRYGDLKVLNLNTVLCQPQNHKLKRKKLSKLI